MTLPEILDLAMVLLWDVVYILIIVFGIKKRICLMPFLPISLNLSWELARCLDLDFQNVSQSIGLLSWLILDLVIYAIHLRFGGVMMTKKRKGFLLLSISVPLVCCAIVLALSWFVPSFFLYFSFFINLLMSCLFLPCLLMKRTHQKEWAIIALFRFLGTLSATIVYGIFFSDWIALAVGVLIAAIDFITFALAFLLPNPKED